MSVPFLYRAGALLAIAGVMVVLDFRKPPRDRHRWREYSVLLLCTLAGMALGVLVDSITARVSPDYFALGKGLEQGEGFLARVLWLGAQAGARAGVIAGAVLLVSNREPAKAWKLLRWAGYPLVGAISTGAIAGVIQHWTGVVPLHEASESLSSMRAERFTTAWVIPLGGVSGSARGSAVGCGVCQIAIALTG